LRLRVFARNSFFLYPADLNSIASWSAGFFVLDQRQPVQSAEAHLEIYYLAKKKSPC
jgi:hypothetical protein